MRSLTSATLLALVLAGAVVNAAPEETLAAEAVATATASEAGGTGPAEDQPTADKPKAPPPDPTAPTKDFFDVVREWRHKPPPPPPDYKKRMVAGAPVISYSPTSGAGVGFAGNVAFFKGYPQTTRISSVVASVIGTTEKQLLASAKINASAVDNHWHLEGDNRFYWTSQDTYGLGTDTTTSDAVNQKFDQFRVHETLYRQLRRNTFLGGGFLYDTHTHVEPGDDSASSEWPDSPYVDYSELYGFDPGSQTSAGVAVHALVDTRDSAINPSRGWYFDVAYLMLFDGFLNGTSSWQEATYDLRTYVPLTRDAHHKLAFWTFANLVTGGVAPYLDLPGTGLDTYARSGRGYPQGRFRGERMFYGEMEYRWTVTKSGLFGMVFFVNTETLSNTQTGEKLFDSFATGAGLGLRLMLNKRSRTNLCLDFGWGKNGKRAAYFGVQEAF